MKDLNILKKSIEKLVVSRYIMDIKLETLNIVDILIKYDNLIESTKWKSDKKYYEMRFIDYTNKLDKCLVKLNF